MVVLEFLIFFIAFLVFKYFWDNRKFFNLARKIPKSNLDYSFLTLYSFLTADTKTIFEVFDKSFKNKKVCSKSWIGPLFFVGVVEPEDVKIILNSKECIDKPFFMKFLGVLKGTIYGDIKYWHSHRKIINPYFGAKNLLNIIPIFNEKVKTLMDNLQTFEDKGEYDVFHSMSALTLETIMNVMEYDVDIQNQKSEVRSAFVENLERYFDIVTIRCFKIWLYPDFIFRHTKMYKDQLTSISKSSLKFTKHIINHIRQQLTVKNDSNQNEKSKTFIRALMDPRNNLSEVEIEDEVKTMIFTAQDTSSTVTSTALMLLGMHKDVQQKVVKELHGIFGKTLDAPYLDYEKISELHYLEMVINEIMRLFPVVPFILRTNSTDLEISNGCILPAKTNIVIPMFELHRSTKIWGEDANHFRPERFEKENFENIHPYAFIPFTKGPRMCVGWRYAMLLMKIQLANILLRYEVDTRLKMDELDFKFNGTMKICQGYKMSIKERVIS
ncbi:unnamed protein product [Chironomus riparius]|uniref:Cytochrome P450 n=1 Tax=Chironomus riparius TaxID=315576 RepID=A0A9N9WUJ3_9DIPT|nr:unnamed protein product [Chironomus riparius]